MIHMCFSWFPIESTTNKIGMTIYQDRSTAFLDWLQDLPTCSTRNWTLLTICHNLVAGKGALLIYMLRCYNQVNPFPENQKQSKLIKTILIHLFTKVNRDILLKNIQPHVHQLCQLHTKRKTKTVQRQSTEFYGLKTTWPTNKGFDNTFCVDWSLLPRWTMIPCGTLQHRVVVSTYIDSTYLEILC